MPRAFHFVLAASLLACLDTPQVFRLRPATQAPPQWDSATPFTKLPDIFLTAFQKSSGGKSRLAPNSELQIVRFVSGEFVRVLKPLPAWKKGFRYEPGAPLDQKALDRTLATHGSAANPGDTVQITRIEFREKEIVVEINGGSHSHYHWREHVTVGVGAGPREATVGGPRASQPHGATLVLDYGRGVPDMSADDLKRDLSGFLDFSKERSAAVQWVETLPPEYRQAIKDRRAVVGMDHDMVIAAMGRPDRKVRERDPEGEETEDWIYGQPPAKTVFVTFVGDKVVRVRHFP